MSIYIGKSPPENIKTGITDKVLTISTNNSNAIDLNSLNNNVLVTIGDYIIGQHSNISTNYEKEFHISNNQDIIAKLEKNNNVFTKDTSINSNLSVVGNIQINNDLTMNNITISDSVSMIKDSVTNTLNIETSNISVVNSDSNQILLQVINNDIPIVYVSNKDNGQMYVEGGIGIGTTLQEGYGIYTESNIRIAKTLDSSNIFTNSVEYSESSITGIYMTDKVLTIGSENVAAQTLIDNFTVGDTINLTSVVVSDSTSINNKLSASNITITNNNANISPLRIINKDVNDTTSVLKVLSEYSSNNDVYTSNIFQITSKGHIVMGVYSDTDTSISDKEYMIRGDIDSIRTPYFNGFLHFTNSNIYQNTTVSPEGYIGIGNGNSNITSMLQIKNNLYGNENTTIPDNFIQLENVLSSNNSTNKLSFIKGISNNNTLFEITSNGSLIFDNIPIDINEYNIAASNIKVYNLDTQNIDNISGNPISFEYNTLSNVTNIHGVTFFASNAIMYNDLNVGSYNIQLAELISVEDYGLTTIHMLAEKVLMTPDNFALGVSTTHYSEPLNRIDTLYLTTESIPQGSNVQAFYAEGSNNNIILTNNNSNTSIYGITTDNTISLSEYIVNDNKLVIEAVNRSETPGENAYLLIHSGDSLPPQDKIGIVVLKNNDIQFTDKVFINKDGFLSVDTIEQNTTDRLTVKGSVNIFNTNNIPTFNIKNDGRVGFATNLPLASMYLHNTLDNTILNIYDTTCNITPFIIDRNGNVGIGTDNTSLGKLTLDNGDILPSSSNVFTLGNINYRWNSNLYKDYILLQDVKLISSSNDGLILEKINNNNYIPFYYTSNNVNYEFYTNSNTMINQYFEKDYINITKNDSDLYYYNRGERIVGDWTISNNISNNITSLTASCWSSNHSQFVAFGESFIGLNRYKRLGYHNGDVDYVNPENSIETVVVKEKIDFLYRSSYSWSYLFTGYFVPSSSGVWTFNLYADNRTYVWLGDYAISGYTTGNYFLSADVSVQNNTITLTKGVMYPIRILLGEAGVITALGLTFSGPDTPTTNDISKHFRTGNTDNAYTSKDGKSWSNIDLSLSENNTNIYNSICWSPEKEKYVAVGYDYSLTNTSNSVILNSSDSINWSYANVSNINSNINYKWDEVIYSQENDLFIAVGESYKKLYDNYNLLNRAAIKNNSDEFVLTFDYMPVNEFILSSNINNNIYEFLLTNSTTPNTFVLHPLITGTVYWEHPEPTNNNYSISFDMYTGNGSGGDFTEVRFNTAHCNEFLYYEAIKGTENYYGYNIRFNEYINNNENRISLFKQSTELYSVTGLYDIDDSSWRTMKIYYQYDDINTQSEIRLAKIDNLTGKEDIIFSYTDTDPILNPSESYISFNATSSNASRGNEHLIKNIYYYNASNIITSENGIDWSLTETYPYGINSLCWSPYKSLYAAISQQGYITTSTDTINWISQNIPNNVLWNSICYSSELELFVAVGAKGNNNGVITSHNGIDWTQRYCPVGGWNKVIWVSELKQFVATGEGNEFMLSIDGIYWKIENVPFNRWNDISWSSELYRYLSVGYNNVITQDVVTNIPGLMAWYTGKSWNGTSWEDISGNGNHCTEIRGTINNNSTQHFIFGNTASGIRFPSNILPQNYTLFHVAYYNGNNRRIFDGVNSNWLSGFHGGNSGVAYHGGNTNNVTDSNKWITSQTNNFGSKIVVSTDQRTLYRGNGIDFTIGPISTIANERLSINYGYLTYSPYVTETSDWVVFEVIVYDRELSLSEIKVVEEYLRKKYDDHTEYSKSDYSTKALISGNPNPVSASFGLDLETGPGGLNVIAPVVNKELAWTTRVSAADNNWHGITWAPELGLFVAVAYTVTKEPAFAMTANTTVTAVGTYIASASSEYTLAYTAFDNVITDNQGWHSSSLGTYNSSTGGYTGSDSLGGYSGEWIKLQLPYSVPLSIFKYKPRRSGYLNRAPKEGVILGSNDNTNWSLLYSFSNQIFTSVDEFKYLNINSTTEYLYYAMVIIKNNGDAFACIGEIQLLPYGFDNVMTSPDGINWTSRTSATDNQWTDITWAPELGLFVAVADSGTNNRVMTSPDGINWTTRTTPVDIVWFNITWAPELGLLVAVAFSGTGNRVMTSPDGINWTTRSTPVNNAWISIVWAPELGLLVAVAWSGSGNRVMTSPDGINWTTRSSAANNEWMGICWSPELTLLVAVGRTGTNNRIMTSPDGINWTTRSSAADNNWRDVVWAPELGLFVAVSSSGTGNHVMTSSDGINWTTRSSAADNVWNSITWAPELGLFAAVAGYGTGDRVMTAEGTKTNKTVLSVKNEKVYVNNSLGIGIEPTNTTGLAIKQPFEPYYTGSSGNTLLHSPGIELHSDTIRTSIFINHGKDLIFSSANYEDNYKGATGYVDYGVRNVKMNFTGQHRCFVDNVSYENLLSFQGLIVSANKNSYRNMSGGLTTGKKAITINESLPVVSITTTSKDRNVFGVISTVEDVENRLDRFGSFVTPYEKIKGDTRAYINSVGEGGIWVSNKRGTLLSGSYITSSDIPGYGEKQDDYILRNYTVAKITMDCDFNPKLIPIKKIKKTEVTENAGSNIITTITNELDEYGNIILEDTEEMEYEYQLRYILQNGDIITENDYLQRIKRGETVYKAAFVGCTYHSG